MGLVAGVPTDLGAESVLARRPEALELARAVGLGDQVVHPAAGTASIWSRGALHPMPAGTLMGVPGTPAAALGVLDAEEIARAESERDRPHEPLEADVSVGEFVEQRMGTAVVDRLVEPLLGGVYAGHARRLSLQAAVPALWAAARSGESISVVAERAASAVPATRGPVFAGLDGGVFQLARTPDVGPHRPRRAHPVRHHGPRGGARRAGLAPGQRPGAGADGDARRRGHPGRPRERRPRACWARSRPRPRGCSPRSPTRPWPS